MSRTSHDVMTDVNCENTVAIPELDAQGVVEYISWDRSEIVIRDEKERWRVRETTDGLDVDYNHVYGTPGEEQIASDVDIVLVERTSRT